MTGSQALPAARRSSTRMRSPTKAPGRPGGPVTLVVRVLLAAELTLSALLYTVGAGRSGWANSYYAAATQAGALSWHAFLYGSLDPAGGMSIDKPPASIWLSALSVRLFGLTPEAVLWPQAACGVATVALLYATVARQAGRSAGLLAAGLLAVTPVFTLMARYNNPDELMVLLLVAAAYATVRALDHVRGQVVWVSLAGVLVGLAFLTKLGQALLVLPCLAAVVMVCAAGSLRRRVGLVAVGGVAAGVSAGWWVALVQATPAGSRPYVGGSTDNSVLGLALGYDGLDRLTGSNPSSSSADWTRLLVSGGQQAGWLLPAAAVLGALGAWWVRRRPPTDPVVAALVLWGGWLVGVGVVLSSLKGTSHSYYSVQVAPAAAALVAVGAAVVWERCSSPAPGTAVPARLALAGTGLGSAVWMAGLTPVAAPWGLGLGNVVVLLAVVGGLGVLLMRPGSIGRVTLNLAVAATVMSAVAAPAALSLATAQAVHHGSGPRAGIGASAATAVDVPAEVVALVRDGSAGHRWAAGVPGRLAADVQLASGEPVFELGGYKARDPSPTLPEFQKWVATGSMHYLLLRDGGGAGLVSRVTVWAAAQYTSLDVAGWTVIDLTRPLGGGAGGAP